MAKVVDFRRFDCDAIVFDITDVDIIALKDKLINDEIGNLLGLRYHRYITIWNNEVRGFVSLNHLYFPSTVDTYALAKLFHVDGKWRYKITEKDRKVDKKVLEHAIERFERERKEKRK